jgi:outer membrane protein OmpA-like peptidoglycan-associated protein
MKRTTLVLCVFLFVVARVLGGEPEWVRKLPFTEDAYWGVGDGGSREIAEQSARRDILIQLSSRVQSAVRISQGSGDEDPAVKERMDAYFGSNRLREAEVVETFRTGGRVWVLMRYGAECGDMLMDGAVGRYERDLGYEGSRVRDRLSEEALDRAIRIERRLRELRLSDYRSEDISVFVDDRRLVFRVVNFPPFETELTEGQRAGLSRLSDTLFDELEELEYQRVDVVGHANPTGAPGESQELDDLSLGRAETMASFLRGAGIKVWSVNGRGGDETIGDTGTDRGRGRNRRVEVVVSFE